MKTVIHEFNRLFKTHKLLVAVIAVIAVPILYAGMFLWAFWDPYDHLEDVPVAIVNEDTGYEYEGEQLELGEELVTNLKEEADFDFHFVDKETGFSGLENEDYYIVIQIPDYFSEYATTVMDDEPKQIEMIYTPNEGYNFLASQIGETAMLKIEMALEEKITETYAETIFDKIYDVSKGLADASDATDELYEGADGLKDGTKEINDNLQKLAGKSLEFKDGIHIVTDGAQDLSDGAYTLANGVGELYENGVQLRDASTDLSDGADELLAGITGANDGITKISDRLPVLIDGTAQVQVGLDQLGDKLPEHISKEMNKQINSGSETILSGINELRTEIIAGLKQQLAPELSQGLSSGLAEELADRVIEETTKMMKTIPDSASKTIAEQVTGEIENSEMRQHEQLMHVLKDADVPDDVMQQVEQELASSKSNYDQMEQSITDQLQGAMDGITLTTEQQNQLKNQLQAQIETNIDQGVQSAVDQTASNVNAGFDEYEQAVSAELSSAAEGLEERIGTALHGPIDRLQTGITAVQDGQHQFAGGIEQLQNGASKLQEGANTLQQGELMYLDHMNTFIQAFNEANEGAADLYTGSLGLVDGMAQLEDGSDQLSDGTKKLADGSVELDDGMGTLLNGAEEFNVEMHDAAAEAGDVKSSDATNNMIANPVDVKNERINKVPNYGTGFAPYFLSLGLFVGALLLSIVYPLREPVDIPKSGLNWFLSKLAVLVSVGVLQAIIASGFLLFVLGLDVQNVPLFFLFAIITSLVFITLIQFLVTCFKDPGRFIAIIILILQLTTSAGTFPLELIPKFLQPFNHILPMTYSVQGFKAVISNGNYPVMWQNAGILIGFMIGFMVLSLVYFMRMYKRKYRDLEHNAA